MRLKIINTFVKSKQNKTEQQQWSCHLCHPTWTRMTKDGKKRRLPSIIIKFSYGHPLFS